MRSIKTIATPKESPFDAHAHSVHMPSSRTSNTYSGHETRTKAYIEPERLKAFTLPSRMGDRLHYPDGKVTETTHAQITPQTKQAPPPHVGLQPRARRRGHS